MDFLLCVILWIGDSFFGCHSNDNNDKDGDSTDDTDGMGHNSNKED